MCFLQEADFLGQGVGRGDETGPRRGLRATAATAAVVNNDDDDDNDDDICDICAESYYQLYTRHVKEKAPAALASGVCIVSYKSFARGQGDMQIARSRDIH